MKFRIIKNGLGEYFLEYKSSFFWIRETDCNCDPIEYCSCRGKAFKSPEEALKWKKARDRESANKRREKIARQNEEVVAVYESARSLS